MYCCNIHRLLICNWLHCHCNLLLHHHPFIRFESIWDLNRYIYAVCVCVAHSIRAIWICASKSNWKLLLSLSHYWKINFVSWCTRTHCSKRKRLQSLLFQLYCEINWPAMTYFCAWHVIRCEWTQFPVYIKALVEWMLSCRLYRHCARWSLCRELYVG